MNRHNISWLVTAIGAIVLVWLFGGSLIGDLEARVDIARGEYRLKGIGLPSPWVSGYQRILHERYGVEYRAIAGCLVSPWDVEYSRGYNKVSMAAIGRKFHKEVFQEAEEQAEREWVHRYRHPKERVEFLFAGAEIKHSDKSCFASIPPHTTMYDLALRCGKPDEEIGTDKYVFIFQLQDGSSVSITTPGLQDMREATVGFSR